MPQLLQLNLLILLWSLTAILGRYLSLQPGAIVFWRTAIAAAVFYFFCRLTRPHLLRISRPDLLRALAAGAILGVHWWCFFGAVEVSNVSIGLAGFASTCLFTTLLESLARKARPRLLQLFLAGLVTLGIVLVVGAKTSVPNAGLGIALALVGAFLAAAYSLISKRLVMSAVPGPTIMLYQISAAFLVTVLGILVFPGMPFQTPLPSDWLPLLILAIACTFAAYLWYARLLKHLSAYTINLAINLEPIYGILMAAVLFVEHKALTPLFYLGTAIIICANVLHVKFPEPSSS